MLLTRRQEGSKIARHNEMEKPRLFADLWCLPMSDKDVGKNTDVSCKEIAGMDIPSTKIATRKEKRA